MAAEHLRKMASDIRTQASTDGRLAKALTSSDNGDMDSVQLGVVSIDDTAGSEHD